MQTAPLQSAGPWALAALAFVALGARVVHEGWRGRGARRRAGLVALAVLTAGLGLAAAWGALRPGVPLAHGALTRVGDTLALPAGVQGARVRVVGRGALPEGAPGAAVFRLGGFTQALEGRIQRVHTWVQRPGGHGRGRALLSHLAFEARGQVAPPQGPQAVPHLALLALQGKAQGALQVDVYRDRLPPRWVLWALALLLFAAGQALHVRGGFRDVGPCTATALAWALLLAEAPVGTGWADVWVRLLVGIVLGVPLGLLTSRVAQGGRRHAAPTGRGPGARRAAARGRR